MKGDANLNSLKITEENLAQFSRTASKLAESRSCELYELSESICDLIESNAQSGVGAWELLSVIREDLLITEAPVHDDALKENVHRIKSALSAIEISDRAILADILTDMLKARGVSFSENGYLVTDEPPELMTYVKNVFSDEAFDVFSEEFTDPRLRYAPTIKDAVRALVNDEVGYALLPLEEKGIRLPTVEELLLRFDLRIVSITPVFGNAADADLTYALVAKNLVLRPYSSTDDRYFEIRVPKASTRDLYGLLFASELFGNTIYRIGTSSLTSGDEKNEFYTVVLKSEGSSFLKMLTYLTLFLDDFVPVGLYKNVE